jgi:hypothetical protein
MKTGNHNHGVILEDKKTASTESGARGRGERS